MAENKRPAGAPGRGPGGGPNKHGFRKPKDLRGTLGKLFGYLADYKGALILVACMLVVSSLCTVAGSYLLKPLINDYILPGDFPGLAKMLMLMAAIYITGAACSYGYARIMVRVSQTTVAKIREDLAACCVVGHHGGLPNFGNPKADYPGAPTCIGRLKKGFSGGIPEYHWQGKLPSPGKTPAFQDRFTQSLWTRMLYSCLVDADYLDTEAFMMGSHHSRGGYDSLEVLLERLRAYIQPWFPGSTELNRNRCDILKQCLESAAQPRGVYSLTVPTGGGKTVSSLAFALQHAVENGLDRVIYVIPYTSIIEQNAGVFREILGENNVVEHHSGIQFDSEDETGQSNLFQRLASENWDAPVIVTTAVQFFESLYSNRSSQCRKLHNIANSVIIFDEAQMIPTCHLNDIVPLE